MKQPSAVAPALAALAASGSRDVGTRPGCVAGGWRVAKDK